MPLARIDLDSTISDAQAKIISDSVYQSLRDSVHAPENDLFHVISRHKKGEIVFSPDYLGIQRTDQFVNIQIFLYAGRTVEQKKLIFKTIAESLHQNAGLRKEDVFITLVDTPKENWSYGNGEAQFAPTSEAATAPAVAHGFAEWSGPAAFVVSLVCLGYIGLHFFKLV